VDATAAPVNTAIDTNAVGVVLAVDIVPCNFIENAVVAVVARSDCIANLVYTPSNRRHADAPVAAIAIVAEALSICDLVLPMIYPIGI